MWYEWLIFGAVFLLIPFAVANLKLMAEKKINPTEEQKKNANIFCGFLMLFYWLCDLFYMAFILDSLTLKFVFGGLVMVIIFFNLSKAFISGTPHFKWGLIQDFLVGVGMSIYLIYIIPSADLKEVVIPIVSAVYGGLITLVGVAWTIRKSDSDRKEEEKKKAKPTFVLSMDNQKTDTDFTNKVCFYEDEVLANTSVVLALVENSEQSTFIIERIFHDGKWWDACGNNVIIPGRSIYMSFGFTKSDNIILQIKDILDNRYFYSIVPFENNYMIFDRGYNKMFYTIREFKEVSPSEIEMI